MNYVINGNTLVVENLLHINERAGRIASIATRFVDILVNVLYLKHFFLPYFICFVYFPLLFKLNAIMGKLCELMYKASDKEAISTTLLHPSPPCSSCSQSPSQFDSLLLCFLVKYADDSC